MINIPAFLFIIGLFIFYDASHISFFSPLLLLCLHRHGLKNVHGCFFLPSFPALSKEVILPVHAYHTFTATGLAFSAFECFIVLVPLSIEFNEVMGFVYCFLFWDSFFKGS